MAEVDKVVDKKGLTPLLAYCDSRHTRSNLPGAATLLFQYGADYRTSDKNGLTALHMAVRNG